MAKRTLGFNSPVFRKKLPPGMTARNYRDNEVVFSQGDGADAVFYIQSGTVKLTVAATRRKKAIIAVLMPGSFFGEGCIGGKSLRICTARSIGQSNITRRRRESTIRTLKGDPKFTALFVAYLLSRIIRFEEDLVDQYLQFQREATGTGPAAVWANHQGIKAGASPEGEPGNPGGDGWHHPRKGK